MTGRIIDFKVQYKKPQTITFELDGDCREAYDELKDSLLDIEIKRHQRKRTLDANAYMWTLIGKLAEKTYASKEDIYRCIVRRIGLYDVLTVKEAAFPMLQKAWGIRGIGWQSELIDTKNGFCNVACYYGSSVYDGTQFKRLVDEVIADCKEYNIETLPPDELQRLIERWK